jgi:phosphomannomutase
VNLRSSNTENVLRLNVETRGDKVLLAEKVREVSAILNRMQKF